MEFKITINWLLTGVFEELTGVVKQIEYIITASDSGESVSTTNKVTIPNPNTENFTSFENLTEEQVISWIESLEQTQAIKNYLAEQLTKKIAEKRLEQRTAPWIVPTVSVYPPSPGAS